MNLIMNLRQQDRKQKDLLKLMHIYNKIDVQFRESQWNKGMFVVSCFYVQQIWKLVLSHSV